MPPAKMNNGPSMTRRGLKVVQCNLRRSSTALMHVLDACKTQGIDVALVHDLPRAVDTDYRSHQGFAFIGATAPHGTHREAGIFVNPQLQVTRSPESSPRAVGIELKWGRSKVGIISGYIQPETAVGLVDMAVLC